MGLPATLRAQAGQVASSLHPPHRPPAQAVVRLRLAADLPLSPPAVPVEEQEQAQVGQRAPRRVVLVTLLQ